MSYLGTALTRSSNATRCPTQGSSITTPRATKLSREEPDAGNLHVRDCGGRGWQHPRLPGRSRAKGGRRLDAATSSAVFETKRRNALRLLRLTANFNRQGQRPSLK